MKIDYINGRTTKAYYGTAKYSHEISRRLPQGILNRIEYPLLFPSRVVDGFTRRYIFPSIVKKNQNPGNIHHITNQDLAFLLIEMELTQSLVTCYDLIPWVYYKNRSRYWKKNIDGLRNAERIITISEFSKKEIIKNVGVPSDRIDVIYCGVDRTVFYPKRDRTPLYELGIKPQTSALLYVGSEEPRKNLRILLEAIARIGEENHDILLLKVGSPGMGGNRQEIIRMIKELHIEDRVIFTGDVSEDMLARYYNAADLFIFPSLYEGFGLPVIEAMACGCPTISADCTSLSEVMGGDGDLLFAPLDLQGLVEKIETVFSDESVRQKIVEAGVEKVGRFSWDRSAEQTMDVYHGLIK